MRRSFAAALGAAVIVFAGIGCSGGGGDDPGSNTAPVASAGADQWVAAGALVALDGSGSSDADGGALTYLWAFASRPDGSAAALSSAGAIAPTFTADVAGTYVLRLTVNDGTVDGAADEVTVTAETPNAAPVASAGPDQSIATGALVTLDGSGSSDADGDALTYLWAFASRPDGSAAGLSSTSAIAPTFTADVAGTYVLRLIVNDGTVDGPADQVTITATTGNAAPMANAGPDQAVATGALVTLDGSGSSDAEGDALTCLWSFVSRPAGSAATLSSAAAVAPTFTADVEGAFVLRLVVNDGTVDGAPDEVTITATTPNTAPVANAGPDRSVTTGALVALDGSGSSDADGDALTYLWSFVSKPAGSAATPSSATAVAPTFTADVAGTYVVRLTVNDGTVAGAPDEVAVTATTPNPAHVPDTGQTASYTATFGEDADYTLYAPSYTVGGDGTVTDDVTGLVWQRQDDATLRQWDAADAYCGSLALPGTGWRLPTPYELMTIQDYGRTSPAIDTGVFSNGRSAYYWTASQGRTSSYAWVGAFSDGGALTVSKLGSAYVRCVRGPAAAAAFADNGNGTVTDAARSLVWQQDDDGTKKTWEQALAYCEGLSLGGSGGWRLPNVKELASIEDFGKYPVADLTAFPSTKENYYWSSTTVASATSTAWQASFLGGGAGLPGLAKTVADAYVRCVRDP